MHQNTKKGVANTYGTMPDVQKPRGQRTELGENWKSREIKTTAENIRKQVMSMLE